MTKHTLPDYRVINENFDPTLMSGEVFKPVPGYEGLYEVSDYGRVVSHKRGGPRVLKGSRNSDGYIRVDLHRDGKGKAARVHRLVAQAHLGPAPDGKSDVLHANDIKTDNRLPNLRYGTSAENHRDRVLNGNHPDANKTRCKHGHTFVAANTSVDADGKRKCISCNRAHAAARYAKKKGAFFWFEWHALNVFMDLTGHADADLTPVLSQSLAA